MSALKVKVTNTVEEGIREEPENHLEILLTGEFDTLFNERNDLCEEAVVWAWFLSTGYIQNSGRIIMFSKFVTSVYQIPALGENWDGPTQAT